MYFLGTPGRKSEGRGLKRPLSGGSGRGQGQTQPGMMRGRGRGGSIRGSPGRGSPGRGSPGRGNPGRGNPGRGNPGRGGYGTQRGRSSGSSQQLFSAKRQKQSYESGSNYTG